MITNTFEPGTCTYTVTMTCGAHGCDNSVSATLPENNRMLPQIVAAAVAGFEAQGWKRTAAVPIERTVPEKDEDGNATGKTLTYIGECLSNCCPDCRAKVSRETGAGA
ncbi:MAG: hypothetical protein ACPG4X_14575 [Pikeienuella sp.]